MHIHNYAMPIKLSASSTVTDLIVRRICTDREFIVFFFFFLQLGLPGDCQLEFVNGGHGIKNPLAIEGQRQAAANREEERAARPPPGKVNIIL